MHFDDRLATVLRQRPTGDTIARAQYRQLVDLLGSLSVAADGPNVSSGYLRLAELGTRVDVQSRVRALQDSSLRLRNPRVVALLAQSEPSVAAAAIGAARMEEEEWLDLVPALPVRARGILRHRRDLGPRVEERLAQLGVIDRGLPPVPEADAVGTGADILELDASTTVPEEPEAEPAPEPEKEPEQIGAIVRRIEEFRKSRPTQPEPESGPADPTLPFGEGLEDTRLKRSESFDFTTDAEGRIEFASAPVAPMVVGLRLGQREEDSAWAGPRSIAAAIQHRQPINRARITVAGAPAITGEWQIDALPRFDEFTGRFTGYSGRARRPTEDASALATAPSEADRMRQILHELRTPVGAIQMSAEVIQQQLYGPTPHEYRALAASIASDTARILAGFEEMERLAKLEAGVMEIESGESDIAACLCRTVEQLKAHTDPRKSGFELDLPGHAMPAPIDPVELERLVWRLLAGMAGAAAPSEALAVRCYTELGSNVVALALPASLANLDDDALFHAKADDRPQALSAGMFGLGFTLRLVRTEANAAGGSLARRDGALVLSLPGLTSPSANLSQE